MSDSDGPSAADFESAYRQLLDDYQELRRAIDQDALDTCLQLSESLSTAMAALPDPQLLPTDNDDTLAGLRHLLQDLQRSRRAAVAALQERMQQERGHAAQDQQRADALRAYGKSATPIPRFHDRKG